MNQQITISKDLVNYLSESLPTFKANNATKIIDFVDQNFVVSDSGIKHFNKIIDAIESIQDEIKKAEIGKLFANWLQEKKYLVNFEYGDDQDCEIALASNSEDKIYFNPSMDDKNRKRYVKKYIDVELHNILSFIQPDSYHRLKHLPSNIPIEKGVYYNLLLLLDPFLRTSKMVQIEDPYLPNRIASQNLFRLIENMKDKQIKLVFLSRNKFSLHNQKEEKIYDEFIEHLEVLNNNGYEIDFRMHFRNKIHRERYLFTEDIQVYFPGGLDFIDTDGYLKNDSNEDISEKKEIRIEKRKFNFL